MIVIMKENATEKQMKQVIDLVTGAGLTTQTSQDNGKTVIGLIGDTEKLVEAELTALEGVEKSVRISLSYKLTSRLFHPENTVVAQIGVNGSLDSENNLNYGVSTTTSTGGQHDVALNGSYRTPWTTLNGSYSQGEGYRQSGIGASGTLIAHRHGVVFSPETGTTMALIEAKDAAGAMLPGSPGTRIDSNGYAILPYLRPYRINSVEIDPKGSNDDVAFDRTVAQVVPWEGSVVKVSFDTTVQNNITVQARQTNGLPLPFAATIFDPSGKEIGVVGQGSMMFISDASVPKATVKWSGGQCSVDLSQAKTKETLCR